MGSSLSKAPESRVTVFLRIVVVVLWIMVLFGSGDLETGWDWFWFPVSILFLVFNGVRLVRGLMERGGEQA